MAHPQVVGGHAGSSHHQGGAAAAAAVQEQHVDMSHSPKVALCHIYQTAHDWKSTLGNFYQFMMDMEALKTTNLSIKQMWSVPHIHAWILWTNMQVSSSMKHNKALHIIKVLQWLVDDCMVALGKAVQESLKRSLKKLHQFSEDGKQQYLRAIGKVMDEEKLIECGLVLHELEQPVFILWLLQRINKCANFFLATNDTDGKPAPDDVDEVHIAIN